MVGGDMRPPVHTYTCPMPTSCPQHGELLMLAAGTGLAPMVPILQSITDNAEDETFVTLVCCFQTFEGIYLKTFLQEQARFWNVRTFFVLSQVRSLSSLTETMQSADTCPGPLRQVTPVHVADEDTVVQ